MTMSLDDSFHLSTTMDSFPCIYVDRNGDDEVTDDSVVTFWNSFYSDCSVDLLEEPTASASDHVERSQKQQPQQVQRVPRRRKSFVLSSSCPIAPLRRSTKSSTNSEQQPAKQTTMANAMLQCRLSSLTRGNKIPRRVNSSERFNEEPKPRTSLELPAVPQRKKSILQFSSSQLLFDFEDDDEDIASVLASLSQD